MLLNIMFFFESKSKKMVSTNFDLFSLVDILLLVIFSTKYLKKILCDMKFEFCLLLTEIKYKIIVTFVGDEHIYR